MVYGGTKWKKQYVTVVELAKPYEKNIPLRIIWDETRIYDCYVFKDRGVARCQHQNYSAHDYEVLIDGIHKRHLYRDANGWFVEIQTEEKDNTISWPPVGTWDPEA